MMKLDMSRGNKINWLSEDDDGQWAWGIYGGLMIYLKFGKTYHLMADSRGGLMDAAKEVGRLNSAWI